MVINMKTDIQIAQEAVLAPIQDVAAKLDITADELELYGKCKAKLSTELWDKVKNNPDGKLNKVAENVWNEYQTNNKDGRETVCYAVIMAADTESFLPILTRFPLGIS